ncbi:MAG: hypothetical protein HUU43_05605 [Ignavibacteriaceae bacterium]|nr:hypothetical protein [Ignavibacteriaceae bacterium]
MQINGVLNALRFKKDILWIIIWLTGLVLVLGWNLLFLNAPAFSKLLTGTGNTFISGLITVKFAGAAGFAVGIFTAYSKDTHPVLYLILRSVTDSVKSVPQILGVLFAYLLILMLRNNGVIESQITGLIFTALLVSLFFMPEISELTEERVAKYRETDFFDANRVLGINVLRIITVDILLKNSAPHVINKFVSLYGLSVFLQTSADFILSVGLSSDVNLVDLNTTLGSLLAAMDSKQDILALGGLISNPFYIGEILTTHLLGVTVAFLISFTLLCFYKISNHLIERRELI